MAELHVGGVVDPATHERTGADVRLPTDLLVTHGVVVGMTGSGKTGLAIVLLEPDGTVTANLRAPIVINPATMLGQQAMPQDCLYPLRHVIVPSTE